MGQPWQGRCHPQGHVVLSVRVVFVSVSSGSGYSQLGPQLGDHVVLVSYSSAAIQGDDPKVAAVISHQGRRHFLVPGG
jgi:hypothetical protein